MVARVVAGQVCPTQDARRVVWRAAGPHRCGEAAVGYSGGVCVATVPCVAARRVANLR